MVKQPAVYLMANERNGAVYTGVTSNLVQRVYQHQQGVVAGFTDRYQCKLHGSMIEAIAREKQIKSGSRKKKLALIEADNPTWRDLYAEIL
jgi:putative endonuclease